MTEWRLVSYILCMFKCLSEQVTGVVSISIDEKGVYQKQIIVGPVYIVSILEVD